jgi:tetratricopeptide (TPR) repeat protein
MAKNRLLDAHYTTLCLIAATLLMGSCSLPRILVLNDPLTALEHVNLGVAYEQKGEPDSALKEYEVASDKLPIAYLYMGNIYFQEKDFTRAEDAYEKAIKKTGDPRALNNLAWLYYTTGRNMEKALDLAQKAVALSPDSPDFRDTLDKIMEKQ